MYTKAAVWATSATPLPMWDSEGSGMVPLPNMVVDFRDKELFEVREADDHLCIFSFVVHARSSMNAGSCGGRRPIAV
jgi:hypothetical protein